MSTVHLIYAALAAASMPTPVDVRETASDITLVFLGEHEGLAGACSTVLQQAEINYDDPRPGTDDITVRISNGGRETPRYTVVLNRVTKEEYEEALATATDADGDGRFTFDPNT